MVREQTDAVRDRYRTRRNKYVRELRRSKKETWRQVLTGVQQNMWGLGYKILRGRLRRKAVGICRLEGGMREHELGSIATEALDKYFPADDRSTDTARHQEVRTQVTDRCGLYRRE
ncbi:hypothetical protein RUM43_015086 [Polyplax serrata]|uniref:Uncharacterized protein n=1 Tax=Polyplax serrata TaxID=468196 RepID=A0AAN8NPU4_POLSC